MGLAAKPKSFGASGKRLIARLAPERRLVLLVIALAVTSASLTVTGPYILGRATDIIFRGFLGMHAPGAGAADVVAKAGVEAGQGIDFDALAARARDGARHLRRARRCSCGCQGYILNFVVQRTVKRLRTDVDAS